MEGTTHLLGGILSGLGMVMVGGITKEKHALVIGASMLGSLLPDIDHPHSKISQKFRLIGSTVSTIWGHRKLFHSPFLYLALYLLGFSLLPDYRWLWSAILAGVASHLLFDMLNPTGIPLIYPLSTKKIHLSKIKTGSIAEFVFAIFCATLDSMLLVIHFFKI